MHGKLLSSISVLYPLDASSTPPQLGQLNVSPALPNVPWEEKSTGLKTEGAMTLCRNFQRVVLIQRHETFAIPSPSEAVVLALLILSCIGFSGFDWDRN